MLVLFSAWAHSIILLKLVVRSILEHHLIRLRWLHRSDLNWNVAWVLRVSIEADLLRRSTPSGSDGVLASWLVVQCWLFRNGAQLGVTGLRHCQIGQLGELRTAIIVANDWLAVVASLVQYLSLVVPHASDWALLRVELVLSWLRWLMLCGFIDNIALSSHCWIMVLWQLNLLNCLLLELWWRFQLGEPHDRLPLVHDLLAPRLFLVSLAPRPLFLCSRHPLLSPILGILQIWLSRQMILYTVHIQHLSIKREIENFAGNRASLFAPNSVIIFLFVDDWRVHWTCPHWALAQIAHLSDYQAVLHLVDLHVVPGTLRSEAR